MTKLLPVVLIICLALMPLAAATGTETRITFNASKQVAPSIWEEWIAWEDYRNDDGSGLSDIYLFNVGSGEESRLTPYGSKAYSPSVNNGEIVWWEGDAINSTWNIMYNTLPPSQSAIIYSSPTNETKAPAVFSGKVVWQDADTTGTWLSDIMMFDASTGETVDLTPGTQDSDQQNPAVYGNTVVWEDLRNGPVPELFMTDTSSGITTPVSIASGIQRAPAIFGNNITWMDTRAGDFDILLYDLDSKILTNVTPFHNGLATDNQENPALQGNRLAWLDNRNRGYSSLFDIMMKNIASPAGETIQVTGSNAKITADYDPALHENRIIWVDERGNNPDIYLYTDGVAAACPVASFTKDVAVGGAPLTVQFTDTSQPSQATYWFWDFGDGTGSTQKNPQHTFNDPGVYMVSLTVGNPFCRNMTPVVCSSYVFADSPPIVDFTASPLAGLPPFSVSFTDKSCGQSTSWAWDFNNDGLIDSTAKNPVNKSTFITPGTEYSVSLTAGNGYGSGPNTTTKNKLIRVFLGNTATAQLPVSGIVTEYRDGFQYLDYNLSTVPDATPSAPMNAPDFITLPPSGYNWEKIMFLSADPDGFTLKSNGNVTGKIARTGFRTRHVNGPASPSIGTGWGIGYQLDSLVYPGSATLTTEVWDGATKTDTADFQIASSKANFLYMSDIPFTARIFNNGFKVHGNATVNLSIQTSWIAAHSDAGTALHIIALGYTPSGDHVAMVLPIKSHISSGGVDYLEADTPGLCSKFALAQHSGGGNVFQMVYLGVTEHYVSPPSGDSDTGPPSSAGGESGQGPHPSRSSRN